MAPRTGRLVPLPRRRPRARDAAGLEIEPQNDALRSGHSGVLRALAAQQQQRQANPFASLASMFGPQLLPQLISNPKFAAYLKVRAGADVAAAYAHRAVLTGHARCRRTSRSSR